jgi:DNA-directed RNA polymerase alpha subunit
MNSQRVCGLVDTLDRVFGKNIHVSIGFSESACRANIEELALSVRSYNAIRRTGISTIEDLIDRLNQGDLKGIRNLGVKSYKEIQTKILVYGFERLSENEQTSFFYKLIDENSMI